MRLTILAAIMALSATVASAQDKDMMEEMSQGLSMRESSAARSVPMHLPDPNADQCGGSDARVTRAVEFIEGNFAEDISLSDIGQASGLSMTQLTARFRQHTGSTPYSYVIDRRLLQATHLLATTGMPIAQVAVETGVSDQQHLTRMFRARLQKTPRQVRTR